MALTRRTAPLVLLAAVAAGLLAGAWMRQGRSPPAAPRGDETEAVARRRADQARAAVRAAAVDLAGTWALVRDDPAIAAATGMAPDLEQGAALGRWRAARERWRRLVKTRRLGETLWALAVETPSAATLSHASRLALVERLLTHTSHEDPPPLYPTPEDAPGLDRYLRLATAVRWEPSMDYRTVHGTRARAEHSQRQLSLGGRRWAVLRGVDEFFTPDGPGKGVNTHFWLENLAGDRFLDPAHDVPEVLLGVYTKRQRARLQAAVRQLDLVVPAVEGDLYLALSLHRLFHTGHLELQLVGEDETLWLVHSRPGEDEAEPGPPPEVAGGVILAVRAGALPKGLRRLRIRAVGLQPIGKASSTISLGVVRVLVGGPPPAVFEGMVWGHARFPEAQLDALRTRHLAERVAPLAGRVEADPQDAAAWLSLGQVYLEFERWTKAAQAFERAVELDGDSPAGRNLRGEARWALGDREGALEDWWASVDLDPAGRGVALLERYAPEQLKDLALVRTTDEFDQLARFFRDPLGPRPAAMEAPRGFRVLPRVVARALDSGSPAAAQYAMRMASDEVLRTRWGRLAGLALESGDEPLGDALIDRARGLQRAGADLSRLRPAVPFLRARVEGGEGRRSWIARGLLEALQVRDLPPVPAGQLDDLMEEVGYGGAPREAARSALRGLGEGARGYLLSRLTSTRTMVQALALEALPAFGRAEDLEALVEVEERLCAPRLRRVWKRTAEALVGRKLPDDSSLWGL